MRRTKEEAEQTRQNLLDAALRVFSRRGYEIARLQDIAGEAGVTRGAIYHHFGSKAELYTALVEEASMEGNALIAKAIGEGGSFLDVLRRTFVYSFQAVADRPRLRAVMELISFKTGVSEELAELTARQREQTKQSISQIGGYIQMGIDSGELRADLDPQAAAATLLATQSGLINLWLSNREIFSIKDKAAQLADIYIYGIAPQR